MESILQIKRGKKMYEGKVTYEEGDLLEVVFEEEIDFSVGDPIPCMITRNYEQMNNFEGVILARDAHRLIIFHSPTAVEFKEQRRRYPRFDVSFDGWIRLPESDPAKHPLIDPMVEVINVSLGGLAFRYNEKLKVKTVMPFYMELYGKNRDDGVVNARLEILHIKEEGGSYLYGCRIIEINSKNLLVLRKYLLQRQLEELNRRAAHENA
ncbi:PilZ domain-containing protein [Brevibacillus migulae]|uniref:PilZ domain-containing protein n=1 Tax=Brevibacillus migulae TaxID=1644114 RepID=UPI00106E1A26|nr:PilZ domain-containing protein [Brevibacillus migulae]